MTHTPGPWHCKEPNYEGLSAGIVLDKWNDPVANCRCSEVPSWAKKSEETVDANAHLIAAAPELLDQLKLAHKMLLQTDWRSEVDSIYVTITKAEGRQP